ncbi:MAG TPA: hypothetical protein VGC99_16430 [Candidatus Tectomicrobia bacterium]
MKGHQTYLGWTLGILLLWVIIIPTMAEQALPATPLPLFEGSSLNLQNFTGKVVVIRFLASW